MLRVLQVVTCMDRGGLETMLMNYYRCIDRTRVQFDFLTHRAKEAAYNAEIRALGGKIYTLPRLNPFSPVYRHALHTFFKQHPEYTVVHAHLDYMSGIVLRCAEKHNVPVRIAHSHTTDLLHDYKYPIKLLYKKLIPYTATDLLACGEDAGHQMFGNKPFLVLPVAIDTRKFSFDKTVRDATRRMLKIQKDDLLIGHVGQFRKEKNQIFLLDVLHSLRACGKSAKLLFVGDGNTLPDVKKRAEALGLTPYVLFLGVREDIPALLQAMDIFCMPSLYEGMPLALLEAQAAGLPCIISDGIPKACMSTPRVRQLSLSTPPSVWAEAILSESKIINAAQISLQKFDIHENAQTLTAYYLQKDAQKRREPAHGAADRIYTDA